MDALVPTASFRAIQEVVEVADSSLGYDIGEKAVLYAEAGVPEDWVLNGIARTLAGLREPETGSYQLRTELYEGA